MSIIPHVVNIPVNCEPRTFERQRRDMLSRMERNFDNFVHNFNGDDRSITPFRGNWPDLINNWTNMSWKHWDDEMRRMRRDMFALLPLDNFGLRNWYTPTPLVDFHNMMSQMERYVEDMRERMGFRDVPGIGSVTDYLKDAYELGEDGKVYLKVRFDVKGFGPEDIHVSTTDDRLTVQGKKVSESGTSQSSREFCRMLTLPRSIDQNQMKCCLTEDGVLTLEAPVTSADYQSIAFGDNPKLGIRPKTESEVESTPGCTTLSVRGEAGLTVVDGGVRGRHLHVELPVDPIYKPEDLCVKVDSNRVLISGKHYKEDKHGRMSSTSAAHFTQSYATPETVDPLSVKAQLIGRTLVLEAPLVKKIQTE